MGGKDAGSAPGCTLHVARQADNVHVRRRVFVVMEPPMSPGDTVKLVKKGLSPVAEATRLPGKQVVIEIAPISDSRQAIYELVHFRQGSVRDAFDYVRLPGLLINCDDWHGVAPGKPAVYKLDHEPKRPPDRTAKDPLLREDVTDFKKVPADEPPGATP
ncbi:MAG: hypothetical protein ACRELB_11665 [Polyangiaceae bacterium]